LTNWRLVPRSRTRVGGLAISLAWVHWRVCVSKGNVMRSIGLSFSPAATVAALLGTAQRAHAQAPANNACANAALMYVNAFFGC